MKLIDLKKKKGMFTPTTQKDNFEKFWRHWIQIH